MARLVRLGPARIPQHVIQRGSNRKVCFCSEQDMIAYAGWLKQHSKEFDIQVHVWVLMTNHIHLLVTQQAGPVVSKMSQALGRIYVRYFNREYWHSGTLWQGAGLAAHHFAVNIGCLCSFASKFSDDSVVPG